MIDRRPSGWSTIRYAPAIEAVLPERLLPFLDAGQYVLELGCGQGTVARYLAEQALVVTGVDINANVISQASAASRRLADSRIQFVVGNVLDEHVGRQTMDAVLLIRVLTCFPNEDERRRVIENAKAALRPGGLLYLRDFLRSPGYHQRYEDAAAIGLPYGTFPVRDAEGGMMFLARHYTQADVHEMTRDCEPLAVGTQDSLSMNGNPCTLFEFIGKLRL